MASLLEKEKAAAAALDLEEEQQEEADRSNKLKEAEAEASPRNVGEVGDVGVGNGWELMAYDSDEDDKPRPDESCYKGRASTDEMMVVKGRREDWDTDEELIPPLVDKTHCIEDSRQQQQSTRRPEVYKMPAHKDEGEEAHILLWPVGVVISTIALQAKLIGYSFSLAMLLLHVSYSLLTEPIHRTVQAKNKLTSKINHVQLAVWETVSELGPKLNRLATRVGYGILASAYIFMLMSTLVFPAVLIDIVFVSRLVEEPVQSKESLHFDYTEPRPGALVPLFPHSVVPGEKPYADKGLRLRGIPKSHRFHITVWLRVPESDHNMQLGMFQVTAEIMSLEGLVLARFTQPCMLRYRSGPIRYAKTLMVAVPLVLGLDMESQVLVLNLVESYEDQGNNHAGTVKIMLEPRAGFLPGAGLPELYDAQVLVQSELPAFKSLIYKWKWTFYVWSGILLFLLELGLLLCCCRSALLITPRTPPPLSSSSSSGASAMRGSGGETSGGVAKRPRKRVSFQEETTAAAAAGVGTRPSDIENFVQRELEALSGTKEKLSSVQEGPSTSGGSLMSL